MPVQWPCALAPAHGAREARRGPWSRLRGINVHAHAHTQAERVQRAGAHSKGDAAARPPVRPPGAQAAELARLRGETALGWVGPDGSLVLAPEASASHLFTKASRLVVLAEN